MVCLRAHLNAYGACRGDERGVVSLVLIGVCNCEVGDRLIKSVALAYVAGEHRYVARARSSQRPPANRAVADQVLRLHDFDHRRELHVAQLEQVVMAAFVTVRPAEEDLYPHFTGLIDSLLRVGFSPTEIYCRRINALLT